MNLILTWRIITFMIASSDSHTTTKLVAWHTYQILEFINSAIWWVGLDISETLDRVGYHALLNKLSSYALSPELCLWIKNFIRNRSIQMVVDSYAVFQRESPSGLHLFIHHISSPYERFLVYFYSESLLRQRYHFLSSRVLLANFLSKDIGVISKWSHEISEDFNVGKM